MSLLFLIDNLNSLELLFYMMLKKEIHLPSQKRARCDCTAVIPAIEREAKAGKLHVPG
jgi:hypothetical protein